MINNGEVPSYWVFEDEYTIAFLDINPVEDGHVLLIPREHTKYIEELSEKTAQNLLKNLIKIVSPIQRAMNSTDSNITINNGPNAGQIIPHVHIHIIPRPSKSKVDLCSLERFEHRSDHYFKDIAEKIKIEIGN